MKPPKCLRAGNVRKLQDVYVNDFYSKQLADIDRSLNWIIAILSLILAALCFH